MLHIGIVAGEASGDYLAAALITALKKRQPDIAFVGIAGPRAIAAGCRSLWPMEKLSVMGLVEVLASYKELSRIRRQVLKHFIDHPPDLFIGVDAPDFNLGLERALRQRGVKVLHYVSPSVWAWRSYRVKKIARAVDLLLTLFPFEARFYEKHQVPVRYVGHPRAAQIKLTPDSLAARRRLALPQDKTIIALMPGSRHSELRRLVPIFLRTAALMQTSSVHFVSSLLSAEQLDYCQQIKKQLALETLPLSFYQDSTDAVLEAADLALLASGTISFEAMLHKCPMVVAYKLNWFTHKLVLALANVRYAALPNFLGAESLVPECLQSACYPERLAAELQALLDDAALRARIKQTFTDIHRHLQVDADERAATAVLELLGR